MKKILALLLILAPLAASAASSFVTATVTITNANGTTNGQTITVNSIVRTWTNSVSLPASQIATNATATGATTNLFNHIAVTPFTGIRLSYANTNAIYLATAPGGTITVTLSAGWGTVAYTTNTLTESVGVYVPYTAEAPGVQTNITSGVVAMVSANQNTNQIPTTAPSMAAWLPKTNGIGWSPLMIDITTTNLINYGDAIRSPGSGEGSEQFGSGADASGASSVSIGQSSVASGSNTVAVGVSAGARGPNSIALGLASSANNSNSIAIGAYVTATNTDSVAIGNYSRTTADNQVMMGSSKERVVVPGALDVLGGLAGTNTFTGAVEFVRYANTVLANGGNPALNISTNVFVEVSGPTGAFSIPGIAGGRDGRFVIILNQTGQDMTIAHQSGGDGTPANRIITMTGADRATTGNGAAMLIYSGAASRWILISLDP